MLASQYCWILSDFFHIDCNITDGMYKGVGGWEAEGGLRLLLRHRQQYRVLVSGTNSHNPQDRLRQSLAIV